MIDIKNLKKGDVFYKAGINGVFECTMDDDDIQEFGSFGVTIKERNGKLGIITKEDYEHLYSTREEAEEGCREFPAERLEQLLQGDKWLEDLFYVYQTYMSENYVNEMRMAIEKKTGRKL